MTINPFTLKELRALTRAKAIAGTLVTFLFACLGICYFVPLKGISQSTGAACFACIDLALTIVLAIAIPINAYARLMRERGGAKGSTSADFTLLTALSPTEVVDGKLRSAFVLMAVFATAAMPFSVFAYLLHGITFAEMAIMLVLTLCAASVMTHVMLAIAAMKIPRALRVVLCAIALIHTSPLIPTFLLFGNTGVVNLSMHELAVCVAASVTACYLLRGATIAFLSPVVTDRDRPLRISALVAAVGWLCYVLGVYAKGGPIQLEAPLLSYSIAIAALSIALGAYASAQPAQRSRRLIAAEPKTRAKRILNWPLASGAANAFAFAFIIGMFAALPLPVLRPWYNAAEVASGSSAELDYCLAIADVLLYVFAFLVLARLVWRIIAVRTDGRPPRMSPFVVPLMAAGIAGILASLPPLMEVTGQPLEDPYSFPFYLEGIDERPVWHLAVSGAVLAIAAALTFLTAKLQARKIARLAQATAS